MVESVTGIRAAAEPQGGTEMDANLSVPPFLVSQLDHDKEVWTNHKRWAREVGSLLGTIVNPFRDRFEGDAKANEAADLASALKIFLTAFDLPKLQDITATVFTRAKTDWIQDLAPHYEAMFASARKIVDALADKLKAAPIPQLEARQAGQQLRPEFYPYLRDNLGLNIKS